MSKETVDRIEKFVIYLQVYWLHSVESSSQNKAYML